MANGFSSWGRYPAVIQDGSFLQDRFASLPSTSRTMLPYGNGRSYGDVCLNPGGIVVSGQRLDRFIAFDEAAGVLRCEAGVLLADILSVFVPRGWFLPVTPGTKFASVGGSIANDVHGKNHHTAGTFGCFVKGFELLRTDGSRCYCSETSHPDLYRATIGGMGLTGFIVWADIALKRIPGAGMDEEVIRFPSLKEFFRISEESEGHEYTVAWVDGAASGPSLGRGLFMRANHSSQPVPAHRKGLPLFVPFTPPLSLVNAFSLKAFNALYYRQYWQDEVCRTVHYDPYFYPLDGIGHWNRMYGPKGFLQYQCVVPLDSGYESIHAMLKCIADSGMGSFLAVLKVFGDKVSPGLVSFPMPGVTLAMDFPNKGDKTLALFSRLDAIVNAEGGRLYPAKDAHVSAAMFQKSYPQWERLESLRDPGIMSGFWARVSGREE